MDCWMPYGRNQALGYRKLVDATAGKFALARSQISLAIGARVRSLHGGSVGAAALVLPGRLPRDDEPDDAPTLMCVSLASWPRPRAAAAVQERAGRQTLARRPDGPAA